jgi:hypothetical protein
LADAALEVDAALVNVDILADQLAGRVHQTRVADRAACEAGGEQHVWSVLRRQVDLPDALERRGLALVSEQRATALGDDSHVGGPIELLVRQRLVVFAQRLGGAAQSLDLLWGEDMAQHERTPALEPVDQPDAEGPLPVGVLAHDGIDALHETRLRHTARIEVVRGACGERRPWRRAAARHVPGLGEQQSVAADAVLDARQAKEVPQKYLLRVQNGLAELLLEGIQEARTARPKGAAGDLLKPASSAGAKRCEHDALAFVAHLCIEARTFSVIQRSGRDPVNLDPF